MNHRSKKRGATDKTRSIPQLNRRLFVAGIVVIVAGYFCLGQSPVSGFLSHTFAPILLTVGYVILIPLSLLFRNPSAK